jgi:uncharacterized protein (TIGR02246 family)
MNRFFLTCALLVCAAPMAFAADDAAAVEQQIKARSKEFVAAWDKHDAKAFAEFYADDADLVTAKGDTFTGKSGIEQLLTDAFQGDLKDTTLTESVEKVRLIKPDVAIVDSEVQIKRGGNDEGVKFHVVSVLVKHDGKWLTQTTRSIKYSQE